MNYLLDTDICVHFFRGRFNLDKIFEEVGLNHCSISSITLAELVYGAEKSDNPNKNFKLIESFLGLISVMPISLAIPLYAKEKVRLEREGNKIADFDLLIGCTAVANQSVLVTGNEKHLGRIQNINIENWTDGFISESQKI